MRTPVFALSLFCFVAFFCAAFAADTVVQSNVATTLERVLFADTLCKNETLSPSTKTVGKKKKEHEVIAERPVILCAYQESDATWHVVKLLVQYPLPACFRKARPIDRIELCGPFPFRVLTPEYGVEYVSGLGIPRLTFALSHEGERLKVYRYRHIWFPDGTSPETPAGKMIAGAKWIEYTPYAKDLHDYQHMRAGARFLYEEVRTALDELRSDRVSSVVVGGSLADAVSWKHLMALALIEQMDEDLFRDDPRRTAEAVFVEYALNRERSFRFSISSANAVGPYQFTNQGGNGTYKTVVGRCDRARLIPEFPAGALELRNVIKAAACLLDIELGDLPGAVQDLYRDNPRVGGIYPVAAYNEGGGGARQLYRKIKESRIDLASIADDEFELPPKVFGRSREISAPRRGGSRMRTVFNEETYMYIRKYLYVWKLLEELGLESPEPSPPSVQ